jgi:hypothetical protein
VIDGAGHGTMYDNREQNIEAIRSFLNRIDDLEPNMTED